MIFSLLKYIQVFSNEAGVYRQQQQKQESKKKGEGKGTKFKGMQFGFVYLNQTNVFFLSFFREIF